MAAEVKLEVPDLWFDLYARLIPGTCFAIAVGWRCNYLPEELSGRFLVVLLAIGYVASFITQPWASWATGRIEGVAAKWASASRDLVESVKRDLGRASRSALILDKMHGEITMYVQIALLSIVYVLAMAVVKCDVRDGWAGVVALLAGLSSLEVACRHVRKAQTWDRIGSAGSPSTS